MEFLFSKFQAYKLQPSALRVFKIPKHSLDKVYWGISFYSWGVQILYRIADLNSFLKSIQVYLKGLHHVFFSWKFPKNF